MRKDYIVINLILLLIFILCFKDSNCAEEKVSVTDRIIGSTFKALAKTFVATADINRLKKNNIDKLKKMENEKFKERYTKVYRVIKDLPPKLKVSYAITEDMTKEQAIRNIESFDKKKMYEMIDSIPDTIIAQQFRQYLSEKKQAIQKSNIVEQINKFWHKIIRKADIYPVGLYFLS